MKTFLKSWWPRVSAPIARLRSSAHISLSLTLVWVFADGLFMDRSIEHMLLGHTSLMLLILVGMILVEIAFFTCRCLECSDSCDLHCAESG
jgi:hypothetical protein